MRSDFRQYIAENYGSLPPLPPSAGAKSSNGLPPLPPLPPQVAAPAGTDALPIFKRASEIVQSKIVLPEQLIEGLLHRACKIIISGGSKSFKSWCLLHQGIAVANGIPWWGLGTKKGTVLYLNFELIEGFFEERILSVCRAVNCPLPPNFLYWNLRGLCYDLALLAKILIQRIAQLPDLALIVVDPIYKALGDWDENKSGDMTKLMNLVETIAVQTGAAVAFGAHHAKGNSAGKDVKDRAAGSGVLARDPDAILTLTRHQQEDCYVVESELRYLPRLSPFVVRWNFPLMQPDESLDPRMLFEPGKRDDVAPANGSQAPFTEKDVLECLPVSGAQDLLWRKMVSLKFGRSGAEFYTMKSVLLSRKLVVKQGLKYYRANINLTPT